MPGMTPGEEGNIMTDDAATTGEQGQQAGQETGQQANTPTDAPKPTPPANTPQQPTQQGNGQQQAAEKVEDLPEWAQKIIGETRKEAGDNRAAKIAAETKYQSTLDAIAKSLGLKDDETPDPDKLAADLTTSQQAHRQTAVELAVYRAASKQGGDPDALLDSRAFLAKVKDLDPSADDFQAKVGEAITSAVADNPKLKAARAAGKGGAEFTGGTGEGAITKEKFDAMSYQERADLYQQNPTVYRQLAGTAAKE